MLETTRARLNSLPAKEDINSVRVIKTVLIRPKVLPSSQDIYIMKPKSSTSSRTLNFNNGIRMLNAGKHCKAPRHIHARDHARALHSPPWAPRAMPEDCGDVRTRHGERRETVNPTSTGATSRLPLLLSTLIGKR